MPNVDRTWATRIVVSLVFLAGGSFVAFSDEYVRDGPEIIVQDASVSHWYPEAPGAKLEVFIEDEIVAGSYEIFARLMLDHDAGQPNVAVHLASPGGSVFDALLIASELARLSADGRQVRTFTTEYSECMSACMIIFMSAPDRWVSTTSELGFHQVRSRDNHSGIQSQREHDISKIIYDLFVKRGIDEKIAAAVLNVSPNEIYVVDGYEAIEHGIATMETPTE